jgi:uncharacterized damage-inducible protein DinB
MEFKDWLAETFNYNRTANLKLLEKIKQLPEKDEAIRLFSHLINCQYKWLARIKQDPKAAEMSWWDPIYSINDIAVQWEKSVDVWIEYLTSQTDDIRDSEVQFIGFDGGTWAAKPKDIAQQLNFHSIHHRAQIQTMIRQQGLEPDFLDYIGTKYRKIS